MSLHDENQFDALTGAQQEWPQAGQGVGQIVFAGNLWPGPTTTGYQLTRNDVTNAFAQAIELAERGYALAAAALRDDDEAVAVMTKWFGPRTNAPRDWWSGVHRILADIITYLQQDIDVYYRGPSALNQPDDYPGAARTINARDVSGYAETMAGTGTGVIGLCSGFFSRTYKGNREISLTGFNSVGGVLVHELSHNLCDTDDHADGLAECVVLAGTPEQAWYNADSIEYFCEEALYTAAPPKPPVMTGAAQRVGAVKATVTAPPTPAAPKPAVVTGAAQGVQGVTQTLTTPPVDPPKVKVQTGAQSSVSSVRDKFEPKS